MQKHPYVPMTSGLSPATETKPHRPVAAFMSFSVGVVLGLVIWATSATLTGHDEPWDVRGIYYPAILAISGALSAAIYYRLWYVGPLGVFVGQATYVYFQIMADGMWPFYKQA